MIILVSVLIVAAVMLEYYLYKPLNIKNLHYNLKTDRKVITAGQALKLEESIYNRTPLPFPKIVTNVEVINRIDEITGSSYINAPKLYLRHKTSLFFFQRANIKHDIVINKRGVYRAELKNLNYSDLLMLQDNWLILRDELEFLVYPQILPIEAILPDPVTYSGDNFVRRFILEDYFYPAGVRDYITGDNTSHIDWKQTARMGQLKVRTYDYTSQEEVSIVLNIQQGSDYWEEINTKVAEQVISIGASVLYEALEEKFSVGLFANASCLGFTGQTLEVEPTACRDFDYLFECTARLLNFPSIPIIDYLKNINHHFGFDTNVVLVTNYVDEDLHELLWRLNGNVKGIRVITLGEGDFSDALGGITIIKAEVGDDF